MIHLTAIQINCYLQQKLYTALFKVVRKLNLLLLNKQRRFSLGSISLSWLNISTYPMLGQNKNWGLK